MKIIKIATMMAAISGLASCSGGAQSDPINMWLLGGTTGSGTIQETVSAQSEILYGNPDVFLNGSLDIPVQIRVTDSKTLTGVPSVNVCVYDLQTASTEQALSRTRLANYLNFNAVSDPNGDITGNLTLDKSTNEVLVTAEYNGQLYEKKFSVIRTGRFKIGIVLDGTIIATVPVDTDGDGVPDEGDAYPEDPSRAFIVRYPSDSRIGYYTLAFENHHDDDEGEDESHSRDVDFNDYVVRVNGEADLNAKGKVVRVRMNTLHVAGGACHEDHDDHEEHGDRKDLRGEDRDHSRSKKDHEDHDECQGEKGFRLLVNLPFAADFTLLRKDPVGNTISEVPGTLASVTGFELLPSSTLTIGSMNTRASDPFVTGMGASVEFVLSTPVENTLSFPYDLHASYKKGKREIHLPGNVFDTTGKDLYLSSNGFRSALLLPGQWKWSLEDVNVHEAYPGFAGWYKSGGQSNSDWSTLPVDAKVYQNQ
jgi:hypothetical protein